MIKYFNKDINILKNIKINVGIDAWHFNPVSEDEINFCHNAIVKFYDGDVFPYNQLN
jgi:hypothetical protein